MRKDFVFLVHPRDRMDWENGFWPARLIPSRKVLRWIGKQMKRKELSAVEYKGITGHLLAVSLLPEQMFTKNGLPQKWAQQYVLEACQFAIEELGVGVIGLGALIAPLTLGGKWLLDKLPDDVVITNGNSLTAAMTAQGVQEAATLKEWNLNNGSAQIALLGAAGSVGTGVSHLLVEDLTSPNILLVGRSLRKIESLERELTAKNPNAKIETSAYAPHVKKADLVVVLTSGPDVILQDKDLKYGAVVYDITQPSNISHKILKKRHDLLVIDGALVATPGLHWGFDLRLPEETSFACLAETIFLAENGDDGYKSEDFTGPVKVETAKKMMREAGRHGFSHASLTSFRKLVLKELMRDQIYLINEKYLTKMTLLL